ncbi:MAG: acyl-CoA thioesterase II [Actinomycetales bacterium]|nr:MAG: acyl-CoA thioesterase II [Actinomycetales bacterium]
MTTNESAHQLPPYHVADLLDVLDLRETGTLELSVQAEPADPQLALPPGRARVFSGPSQKQRYERTFGGQLLAQAIVAASRTVTDAAGPGRTIASMHTIFLAGGDDTREIRYAVEPLSDGRSFSTRRVLVMQDGRILSVGLAVFQEAGPPTLMEHQEPAPEVPDAESLRNVAAALEGVPEPYAPVCILHGPIELRHVEGNLYAGPDPTPSSRQGVWLRSRRELPDDPAIHAAFLAYASDYSILESVLRRHDTSWNDPRLRQASLDHTIWFHRFGRADEWVLHAGHSPSASGGRGLGLGRMYAMDGTLLASIAQEGMLRLKE